METTRRTFLKLAAVTPMIAVGAVAALRQPALANDSATKEVTDVDGRTITLPAEVKRVVVTFNLEEYLAVAGEEGIEKLVGFSHSYWKGRRQDAWDTFTAKFPKLAEINDIGYNDTINVEAIIALMPDVVIMSSPVNKTFIEPHLDKLAAAGIQVAFVNYHKQTLEMHRKSTEMLGQIMGQEERAKEIADFYEAQMQLVSDGIAMLGENDPRPKVYMEFSRGVNEYGNTWSTRMWGALIGQCGGTNIAADLGDANSVDIAPEQIIASDPEIIIFTASPQTDIDNNVVLGYGCDEKKALSALEAYKDRKGWASLSAVKNNRMGALYHDLSRHIFDFAGAQFLAKQIQPELFADLDPQAVLAEFFEKFMPVELEGAWMIAL
ncbi:MAG: ABC transporter substrate-binding protein [Coriobacteriales bacterium]|nr:ABC transporter substrate-binding protein [Coriobacteriales bacterium]